MKIWGDRSARTSVLALFVASSLAAFGQSGSGSTPPADQNAQVSQSKPAVSLKQEPDDLKQELDADAMALSKVPADPLLNYDPFASVFQPVNKLTDTIYQLERLVGDESSATAGRQISKLRSAGSSLFAWLWLAAHSDRWD